MAGELEEKPASKMERFFEEERQKDVLRLKYIRQIQRARDIEAGTAADGGFGFRTDDD